MTPTRPATTSYLLGVLQALLLIPPVLVLGVGAFLAVYATVYPEMWLQVVLAGLVAVVAALPWWLLRRHRRENAAGAAPG